MICAMTVQGSSNGMRSFLKSKTRIPIRFLYAKALHQTGKSKEAFAILNENGGLIPDDFREGKCLWNSCGAKFRKH